MRHQVFDELDIVATFGKGLLYYFIAFSHVLVKGNVYLILVLSVKKIGWVSKVYVQVSKMERSTLHRILESMKHLMSTFVILYAFQR